MRSPPLLLGGTLLLAASARSFCRRSYSFTSRLNFCLARSLTLLLRGTLLLGESL